MATRRVPLASNSQAVNSPLRPRSGATKRLRDETRQLQEDQPPAKKRQILEPALQAQHQTKVTPIKNRDSRVFDSKNLNGPHDFQQKLAAARGTRAVDNQQRQRRQDEQGKARPTEKDQIITWRKHYQKVFPSFVFYFESLTPDAKNTSLRAVSQLGARAERFFSRDVTHIVTTRPIPPSQSDSDPSSQTKSSSSRIGQSQSSQAKTINPSLLDKHAAEPQSRATHQRSRAVQDLLAQPKPPTIPETRRPQASSADILVKARDMGMKIWPYEKFTRMLDTLIELKADEPEASVGRKGAGLAHTKQPAAEADLQQLLKNEKNMHSGQLPWSDVIAFRAYYIYVHDVEEKNRPVMMREYERPKGLEEGEWPQLHASSIPRCPFVADSRSKRDSTEQAAAEAQTITEPPRTRAASAAIDNAKSKPAALKGKQSARTTRPKQQVAAPPQPSPPQAHVFEPPQLKHAASNATTDSLPAHLTNRFHYQGIPRAGTGREPLASGLQRSNQTSAIQSQMVSSTAANPVARIGGKSKEMHELQRRAVEQRRNGLSVNSVPSSYMNDVRAAINHDQNSIPERGSRRRAPTTLTKIYEDETQTDDDDGGNDEDEEESSSQQQQRTGRAAKSKQPKKKEKIEREPKPGYCENCRDKFDDFQEHVVSRKHRKFAMTAENWKELDGLLKELTRK